MFIINDPIKKKGFFGGRAILILFLSLSFPYADSLVLPSQKIRTLSEQLDSLNLVKQTLKRKGIDITEIEAQQGRLRDSLEIIKKEINERVKYKVSSNNLEKTKNILPFLKNISDFFDLLIVGLAVLAGISGLLLIRELYRNIRLKKLKKVIKIESKENTELPKPSPAYPSYTNIPPSLREYKSNKEDGESDFKNKLENVRLDGIENLEKEKKVETLEAIAKEEIPIEEKILKAAKMGFEISAISRSFHLSVDEISLILKVAGSKQRRR
ncbi:MAG: hypothetical protein N2053_08230 [Chitinispirillaceae bacterium]|nr:hypothetical protein [Chitinispirillaceae bacterium]